MARRDQRLDLRVSKDELSLLDECAKGLGMSRVDTVNKGIELVKVEIENEKNTHYTV